MSPGKVRFVTACQQLLALGVVLAVLTPATGVVSLDVLVDAPGPGRGGGAVQVRAAASTGLSRVETEAVEPRVTEYPLRPVGTGRTSSVRAGPGARQDNGPAVVAVSGPEPVDGLGAVGVTWSGRRAPVPAARITVQVRTHRAGEWSGWTDLEYDADHAPDPGSREARRARPGTDPFIVGEADQVQTRARLAAGALPADLRMAVVEPGESTGTTRAAPAIDTGGDASPGPREDGVVSLRAGTYTPRPRIFSRAQWGADERLRDRESLRYHEVHAGFVHHTVNGNDYTRAQVPGIIRSIYAYHTRSRGWSDIGYNFLVDRFGRVWEGRYGGVDRPVVGAHTSGYNEDAFAMSAIGNFETASPGTALLEAYGSVMAWKLSLHGVSASSTSQRVGSRTFPAINGHRDADATACPGRNLYARLPSIRTLAAAAQRDWSGREREMDLVSTRHPDLLLRRTSDDRLYLLPTGGLTRFLAPVTAASGFGAATAVVGSPDLTGDGRADVLARDPAGTTQVHPGTAAGGFGPGVARTALFRGFELVTAAGDLNGDRRNDVVARWPRSGRLFVFLGDGRGRFERVPSSEDFATYDRIAATGDLTGDRRADLVGRDTAGRLQVHAGNGRGGFGGGVVTAGRWGGFDTITGYGDFTGDARPDLVVRAAGTGRAFVVPSRGDGTFAARRGPVLALRGLAGVSGLGQFVGNPAPDLVGLRGGRLVVVRNSGGTETRTPVRSNVSLAGTTAVLNVGDWDRDGNGDVVLRTSAGGLQLRRGDGLGGFAAPVAIGSGFARVQLLAAVGDVTGDGWPDLMGQPAGVEMRIYPGRGTAGLARGYRAYGPITATQQLGVGRWNTDGAPDSLFRSGARLILHAGNGPGGLTTRSTLPLDLTGYDRVVGIADLAVGGHPDLVLRSGAGHLWAVSASATRLGPRRLLADRLTGYDLVG